MKDGQHFGFGRGTGDYHLRYLPEPLLAALLQVSQQNIVLGPEVLVEAGLRHSRLGNELVDAGERVALLIEQAGGRIEDALADVGSVFRFHGTNIRKKL